MTCKHEQDCKGFTPKTTGKSKHKHERGERYTGAVDFSVPEGNHLEYVGEVRVAHAPDICAYTFNLTEPIAKQIAMNTAFPYEILILVPDGPLVKVDWWDKQAKKHSYQFYGEVDWPRIKRECFDEDHAEIAHVSCESKIPDPDNGECRDGGYTIHHYDGLPGWSCHTISPLRASANSEMERISEQTIVAAIRKHNKPAVPEWYREGWWTIHSSIVGGLYKAIGGATSIGHLRPAYPNDLAVEIGGKKCWFVEYRDGDIIMYSLQVKGDTKETSSFALTPLRDERSIGRAIAKQFKAPIIPRDQWEWLQARKEGK